MKLAVLWQIFSVEARKRMSYRVDFWINSLGGLAVNISVFWALTEALFAAGGRTVIGGYTQYAMLLYYLFAALTGRVVQSGELEMATAQDIYEGTLSKYLLYPIPYTGVKYAQQWGALAPQMLQLIVFGFVAPLAVIKPPDVDITAGTITMYLCSLFVANLLHYILLLPVQAVAFWADNVWSLAVAMRFITSLFGGLLLPLELFPAWVRPVIDALPFTYLYSTPVRVLLGRASVEEWGIGLLVALGWCVVIAFVLRWVWRRGELQYTGVGI
jgi:ABC-2 type transport system permease protein